MNNKLVIFDFDGTLLDTQPDIIACMEKAAIDSNIEVASFRENFRIGPPLYDAVAEVFTNENTATIHHCISLFRDYYDQSTYSLTTFYPGVESLLSLLNQNHVPVYIATNKRLCPTLRLVEHFGWKSYLSGVVSHDLLEGKIMTKAEMIGFILDRTGISPSHAVMVGDTAGDINAGHDAGCETIGVDWGYGSKESLMEAAPSVLVHHCQEIVAWLNDHEYFF